MAIDGVVGGMQGADALLLAESVGGIRRGLAPTIRSIAERAADIIRASNHEPEPGRTDDA
jgi:hypothetical protein